MSNFTTEVRWICETAYQKDHPGEHGSIADNISAGRGAIFDFNYPIFDETYRSVLETKILKHYYTREIGEETVGLWKLRLDARMNEIMPFYNKLYDSELLQFNPLHDIDLNKTGTRTGESTKSETDNGTSARTDAMTGTVGDSGSIIGSSTLNTVTENTTTDDISVTHTGTIADSGTTSNTKTRTGTESTESEQVVDGTVITQNTGNDVESTERDNTNDHWDYYSDTPQGTIGYIPGSEGTPQAQTQLANQTYLTNVRHVTDSTDGSSEERTMTHGHRVQADDDTTTTVESTLTLNTTETDAGTNSNTRTFNNTDTTAGEQVFEGDVTETGSTSDTTTNTRTYNTLDTQNGTTSNTATGSYENTDEYVESITGKHGSASYARMLMEFRETFLNIDAMIIENLSDLFFGLWG